MKPDGTDRHLVHLPTDTGSISYDTRFVWSSDGSRIAFVNGADLLLADLATGVTRRIYRPQNTVLSGPEAVLPAPAWNPDGTMLAFIEDRTLHLARLDTGQIQTIADDVWGQVWAYDPGGSVAWAANGRFVLYLSGGAAMDELHGLAAISLDDPAQSRLIAPNAIAFALSPDDRYMTYHTQDGGLWQTEVRCLIPKRMNDCPGVPRPLVFSSDDPGFLRLRWSPDGSHLLAFSLPSQLWLLDAFSGESQPIELNGAALYETNPWSPDGHQLILPLIYEGGMTNCPLTVYNVVTRKTVYLSGFETFSKQREAAWGRALPTAVQAVPIKPVVTAPSIRFESWSPNNEILAYWTFTAEEAASSYLNPPGALHFFNIRTGQSCQYQAASGQTARSVAWVTDGKIVVFSEHQARQGTPCHDDFIPVSDRAVDHIQEPALSLSPNGTYRANTVSQVEANGTLSAVTTIVNAATGQMEDTINWKHRGGLGGLGLGGQWLTDDRFLISETLDRGPLLVIVGKEIIEVAPKLFGIASLPSVPDPDEDFVTLRATASDVSGTQSYHIVLSGVGTEAYFPRIRLYHPETGEVEELPLKHLWWPAFSPDGRWLLMDARPNKNGYESHEIWTRPLDPVGSDIRWLISDVSSFNAWSYDETKIAGSSAHEIFVLSFPAGSQISTWQIGEYEGVPMAWSSDGQSLAVHGYVAGRQQDALFVIQIPQH
jgi:WD40-like Beta Propeller Repeat